MHISLDEYLEALKNELLYPDNFRQIILTRQWAKEAPNEAGVYVIKERDNIVYVGETGNLRGRMTDLLDSRQHCIRRTLGEKLYKGQEGFRKATSSDKFPELYEVLLYVVK